MPSTRTGPDPSGGPPSSSTSSPSTWSASSSWVRSGRRRYCSSGWWWAGGWAAASPRWCPRRTPVPPPSSWPPRAAWWPWPGGCSDRPPFVSHPRRTLPVMSLPLPTGLSPSKVSSFKDCALAFRFSAIDHLPEPPAPHLAKGTLVHRALELLFCEAPADRTVEAALAHLQTAHAEVLADPENDGLVLDDE